MEQNDGLTYIGSLKTELTSPEACPKQGYEGSFSGELKIKDAFKEGLKGIEVGSELVILCWLHQANRDLLQVHPRNDQTRPLTGVFVCRSPHRPNPIGLHEVRVDRLIDDRTLIVSPIDVLNGTPVIDVKLSLQNRGEKKCVNY